MPKFKHLLSFSIAIVALLFCSAAVQAVPLELVRSQDFGAWETALLRNGNSGRLLCAAQVKGDQETIFRLNFYLDGDAFLEFINPTWALREMPARFSLDFGEYVAELRGQSYVDALTHDFTDQRNTDALLGLLAANSKFDLRNANGAPLDSFSLNGSKASIDTLAECLSANAS